MNFFKKMCVLVIIVLFLIPIYPQKAHADTASGIALATKEYGLDGVAFFVANQIIRKITNQTVNWINSGFKGNPAYVTEPGQFFLDIADNEASRFLSQTSLSQLCSPFSAEVRLALVKNYLSETSGENYSCTLDILKDNYDAFTDDFSVGGWDGWFEVTQRSQNNPYGAYLNAQNELAARIGSQQQKYQDQLQWGRGFLSYEKCPDGQTVTQESLDAETQAGNYYDLQPGDCWVKTETVTPGSVVENQLNKNLSSGLERIQAADEINEIIGALLDQLLNKALGSVGGLFGASRPDESGNIFTEDLLTDVSDQPESNDLVTCTPGPRGTTTCVANPQPAIDTPAVICTPNEDGVLTCNMEYDTNPTNPPPATGGTGGSCVAGGMGNSSGAPSTIDESQIIWGDADIGGWAVTANLNVSAAGDTINLNYDKANEWPLVYYSMFNGDPVVGNAWVVVWRDGAWRASTFEWLRPGQTSKGLENLLGADGTLVSPLGNFTPKVGELYGFVVSTPARGGNRGPVNERSNVYPLVWNADVCSSGTGSTGGTGGTTGGGTLPPGGTGGATIPLAPRITSVTPTAVKGGDIITITGTDLRNTLNGAVNVQFFDYYGNRDTVVGISNSTGTQVTAVVPAGLSGPSGYVRMDNGSGLISNSIALQIGTPLEATAPTNTWSPTQTGNGWWPRLSPDGRYVAYGNWGESWLTDMQTGQNYNLSSPAGLQQAFPGSRCIAGQWITPTKLTYVCELGDSSSQGRNGFNRYEVDISTGSFVPVLTSDDPLLVSGSQFVARDGHWASYLANATARLAKDNQVVATGVGGAMDISGDQIVHACTNNNTSLCLRNGTALTRTISPQAPINQAAITNGYIIYGGYGPIRGITPSGTDTNLRLSNSYSEGGGKSMGIMNGSAAQVISVNGSYWVASVAWGAGGEYIFLRPWGSRTAIVVEAEAASIDVIVSGTNFIIAYNNARGGLVVVTVPISSPRISIP